MSINTIYYINEYFIGDESMKCPFCIKVCNKCKRILVAYKRNFYSHPACKYGFNNKCKECAKKYGKQWREDNPEYNKQWYKDNKEHHNEVMKQYYEDNKEYFKQYYEDNKEQRKEYDKQHYEDNKEHMKGVMKQYYEDNKEQRKEYDKQKYDKYLKENNLERGQGSYGEQKVRQVLREHEIVFSEQYRFDDCKFKLPLPFDFYLPNLNTIIEYDGMQHFEIVEAWGGIEHLIDNVIRDTIKNEYCKANNIKLIRIPYYEFDRIEEILSDLL
jgi:hypothetical protein